MPQRWGNKKKNASNGHAVIDNESNANSLATARSD
jgi:hypothetical protein